MKLLDGKPLYSATDLLNFLGCHHASALDIQVMSGSLSFASKEKDEYQKLLSAKGDEHEHAYLEKLRNEGRSVAEIPRLDSIDEMVALTRAAMRDGVDVIFQGALTVPGWHGYSDFLLKTDHPSALGPWSYEVADTKLARSAKPKHVVQLSLYSEIIAREQGIRPTRTHVVLGDQTVVSVRLHDFVFYCNHVRGRFDGFASGDSRETVAERCAHCELCRWSERCDAEWDRDGNLRLVAGLSAPQARKLRASGITTIEELASVESGAAILRIQPKTLERLKSQARLQMFKRATKENRVELLAPVERCGFARLPEPNEGDIFFDMEGDPVYSPQGSLEYLFGFHYVEGGENRYQAFWARDRAGERKAFEEALDFITTRIEKYPDAYVYHYASYEQTALKRLAREYGGSSRHLDAIKRLAQSYGTRENEVDDLLRNRKMVDLYKVVREAVQTSEPAYSLKNLEVFFAEERTQEITSGGDSVVAFERWLKLGDDAILEKIERYNEFDCLSTRLCRDWLLSLRPPGTAWLDPAAERAAEDEEKEKRRRADDERILGMREALVAGFEGDEREWRELLGYLLEHHRREARSEWWKFFDRLEPDHDPLEDMECIGGLTVDPEFKPRPEKKSMIWRLRFPEQETKIEAGNDTVRVDTGKSGGEIVAIDHDERWLEIKVGPSKPAFPELTHLARGGPLMDVVIRDSVARYADSVIAGDTEKHAAITSILRRDHPRLDGSPILPGIADPLTETIAAVERMDRTHMVIQGPPGSGKTFTSAHAIVSLLANGKRVGVTSLSHKAINNLLRMVEKVAAERGVAFTGVKLAKDPEDRLGGAIIEDVGDNKLVSGGDHQLIGGTAWLFSRPEMEKSVDYLFVDEAGQVSLANVVATGMAAENIVLVGDQMQLSQPAKGQHPGGSGVSALDYLMRGWAVVPDDRGIFLGRTWRMHPDLCRFISAAFYDDRLESAECTIGQRLHFGAGHDPAFAPTGLRFVEVVHADNTQRSQQEAERVANAYGSLLGTLWTNEEGDTKEITDEDILVVSPYNLQVSLLKRTLPPGARVGTVDKFQGQEAAVVLVSMASSTADDAPRGIDFIFSKNRLNVALSRARCLSVIFCCPALLDVVCTDLEKMNLVNTVCWAREYAGSAA